MPNEPATDWLERGKTAGGILAFILTALGSLKFWGSARNAGHLDRIIKLERREKEANRVMQEAVQQLQELAQTVDIDRGDSHRRFNRVEGDVREFRREVSQNLRRIADQIDEQLSRNVSAGAGTTSPGQKPEPPD